MARIRTIKPEFWTDSKTGSLSGEATKLFIGMLNFADDYGVLESDIAALKAKIFPYTPGTPVKILTKPLSELFAKGLVIVFKWDERSFYWIRNFEKHQKVDKPGKPLIEGFSSSKLLETLNNQKIDLGFDEHSPKGREHSPCSVSEGSVVEGKGKEGKGEECEESLAGKPAPPSPKDFLIKWNEKMKDTPIPQSRELSKERIAKIKVRLIERPLNPNNGSIEAWVKVFERIAQSKFCQGENDRGWKASLDWIVGNSTNALKVLEGKYENKHGPPGTTGAVSGESKQSRTEYAEERRKKILEEKAGK